MSVESILIVLLVGAIAGWLATIVVSQYGFGLLFNIVIGVLGGLVGTWLFPKLGISISGGFLGAVITGTVGAILILLVVFALQGVGFVPRRRL